MVLQRHSGFFMDAAGAPGAVVEPPPAAGAAGTGEQIVFDLQKHLPADMQGEKHFESFAGKPIGEVFKSGLEAHKLVGSSLRIPKPEADDKEWDEKVFSKLRPESAEKYDLKVAEGMPVDEALLGAFKKMAFDAGMPQKSAQRLLTAWNAHMKTLQVDPVAAQAEAEAGLKKEWGAAFPKNLAAAQRAFKKFGDEQDFEFFSKGDGNKAQIMRFAAKVGLMLEEDMAPNGGSTNESDRATAQARIKAIMADPAYADKNNPMHKGLAAEKKKLYELLHGTAVYSE